MSMLSKALVGAAAAIGVAGCEPANKPSPAPDSGAGLSGVKAPPIPAESSKSAGDPDLAIKTDWFLFSMKLSRVIDIPHERAMTGKLIENAGGEKERAIYVSQLVELSAVEKIQIAELKDSIKHCDSPALEKISEVVATREKSVKEDIKLLNAKQEDIETKMRTVDPSKAGNLKRQYDDLKSDEQDHQGRLTLLGTLMKAIEDRKAELIK